MGNPYTDWLLENGKRVVSLNPDLMEGISRPALYKHWKARNEWRNAEMANVLLVQSHLYALENSAWRHSRELMDTIDSFFRRLEMRGHGDRWYHLEPGMGDRNIDRFTLAPLMEAFMLVRGSLDISLQASLLKRIKGALDVQFREYGLEGKPLKRQYPNMDVYYCLIMLLGARLTGDSRYESEFERLLDFLEGAQFEHGAWTYVGGTNESPQYHDLLVILIGRIHHLTRHEKAWSQLQRSISYYPITATPGGLLESHTDCWWKHQWKRFSSFAPDVLSSVTGDGRNRWLGEKVRPTTWRMLDPLLNPGGAEIGNIHGLFLYYASLLWAEAPSEPIPGNRVLYDANIEGPRGHMDGWSWAATGRFGCDTVVGATAHTDPGEAIQALMAVTPEIPYYPSDQEKGNLPNDRWDLATMPRGSKGTTRIEGDKAVFDISYQPACCREFWNAPAFPLQWRCEQHWVMDNICMVGHIRLTSLTDQTSPLPCIRIRFGEGHLLREMDAFSFSYGSFRLFVESEDFTNHRLSEAPIMLSHEANHADELVLFAGAEMGEEIACFASQEFKLCVTVEFKRNLIPRGAIAWKGPRGRS